MSTIEIAKSLNWQDPSKFKVQLLPTGSVAAECLVLGTSVVSEDIITASITSIQLPNLETTPIEGWIGEQWRFTTGRLEIAQIELSFKDSNNYQLYKMWSNFSAKASRAYPNDQKFDIKVYTASTYDINTYVENMTFKECILTTVSGPTLDNTANASIAEFNVIAKYSYVQRGE